MDKIIKHVDEVLWKEVKAQAALEGKKITEWVEEVIRNFLDTPQTIPAEVLKKFLSGNDVTKILKNVDEQLWREVKARSALEGISMKKWVEGVIAFGLSRKKNTSTITAGQKKSAGKMKVIKDVDEQLWREVKARSALEGISMKEWVEKAIYTALSDQKSTPGFSLERINLKKGGANTEDIEKQDKNRREN